MAAVEAARQASRELEPVSVLISRKTQRLYVRQGFEPILESPVTIRGSRSADRHAYLHRHGAGRRRDQHAVERRLAGGRSPHGGALASQGRARADHGRDAAPTQTDTGSAKGALDRIVIPQDALDRIAGIAPRSSLIITDEALSSETGKGTDFVVLLSGEPQGGIKIRRRDPGAEFSYARPRDRLFDWR